MKKTIGMTLTERPQYLAVVLDSLAACPEIGEWDMFFVAEPCADASLSLAQHFDKSAGVVIERNSEKMGVHRNRFRLCERMYERGADYALWLDEDNPVTPNALHLLNWYIDRLDGDRFCGEAVAHCSLSAESGRPYPPEVIVFDAKPDHITGTLATPVQWEKHAREVFIWKDYRMPGQGCDWSVISHVCHTQDLYVVRPMMSRVNHIGVHGRYTSGKVHEEHYSWVQRYEGPPPSHYRLASTCPIEQYRGGEWVYDVDGIVYK